MSDLITQIGTPFEILNHAKLFAATPLEKALIGILERYGYTKDDVDESHQEGYDECLYEFEQMLDFVKELMDARAEVQWTERTILIMDQIEQHYKYTKFCM